MLKFRDKIRNFIIIRNIIQCVQDAYSLCLIQILQAQIPAQVRLFFQKIVLTDFNSDLFKHLPYDIWI